MYLKYGMPIIEATNHKIIDRDTAEFLNTVVKLNLEYEEETGGVDMCLAMEKKEKRDEINGVIKFLRLTGESEADIIWLCCRLFLYA